MATISILYKGEKRTTATHLASGSTILTDAPLDNNGKGETFSPTDLLCSSLASCMLTIMGISAEKNKIKLDDIICTVTKTMGINPRRVVQVDIHMDVKNPLNEKERKLMILAAENCPVAKSIHPDILQNLTWSFA